MFGIFGKKQRIVVQARRAELEGDLARAATLFAEGGRADEAARVLVMRGDAEIDPVKRRQHYVQAVALAEGLDEGHAVRALARRKRALLAVAAGRDGATSAAARQDLIEAAADLEAIGDAAKAAEAYALAGDVEGEARTLVEAGDVERLEEVLDRDHARESDARRARAGQGEIDRRMASGQRREALALAEELARGAPGDAAVAERARAIRAARSTAPRAAIELRGRRVLLAMGDEVTIGRTDEATIAIASHAVSRRHLAIARGGDGGAVLRDLGSRNGTELRGMRLAGGVAIPIPEQGIEVRLGGEVRVHAAPSAELAGAVVIDAGGARVTATLGPARVGVGAWRIEAGDDGWLELVTDDAPPAFLGAVQMGRRTPLVAGDAFAPSRGGAVVLRVAGPT